MLLLCVTVTVPVGLASFPIFAPPVLQADAGIVVIIGVGGVVGVAIFEIVIGSEYMTVVHPSTTNSYFNTLVAALPLENPFAVLIITGNVRTPETSVAHVTVSPDG